MMFEYGPGLVGHNSLKHVSFLGVFSSQDFDVFHHLHSFTGIIAHQLAV